MNKATRIIISGVIVFMIILGIGLGVHKENIEIIRYPSEIMLDERPLWLVEINGIRDKRIQKKLNENIMIDIKEYLEDYFKTPCFIRTDGFYSDIVRERYLYFSYAIKFDGYAFCDYYNVVYDLKTGEKVNLDDLFILDDGFIMAVKQYGKEYAYDRGENIVVYPGYENDTKEEIEQWLQYIVMEQSEWNEMEKETWQKSYSKPDFLVTEEELYLSVPIPLDKLEDYLKVEKWW